MNFKYTFVTIIIILLGGFFWSNGSDSDYPSPRKIDIEFDNFRGDCTSCSENYDPLILGATCCDQASAASEFYTCTVLEDDYLWNCSGCECDSDPDFVSMYGCTDPSAANYSEDAIYPYGVCWYSNLTAVGDTNKISLDWDPYGIICEDSTACNYNLETLSGCVFAEENYNCDDECIATGDNLDEDGLDCVGECGGSAVVDECLVCGGDGAIYECGCADIPAGDCDCDGNVDDCAGDCGGDAVLDSCGDCDNDPSNDCITQCEGEFDDCGMCTGEGTGLDYNYAMDCLFVCPGDVGYTDAQEDECGVCQGSGAIYSCGCADIPAGDCDCAGNVDDCLGNCGGSAVEDECGVCDGDGKATCYIDDNEVCDLEECTIYYNVYKSEEGVDENEKISSLITETGFTDIGIEYINTFYYNVTYIDGRGDESPYSNTADARPIVLPDFSYSPSTIPMAYSFASIELVALGGSNIITLDDWVGAFKGDVCVGAMQITASTAFSNCGLVDCATMYLFGDDGSAASVGYMSAGDTPSFKIWDGSTNNYYDADNPTSDCLAFEGEGACCSEMLAADIFGCIDAESCNFDTDATVDDGSCLYNDCAGECGGDAIADSCEVCSGGSSGHVADSDIDECGECFENGVANACDCDDTSGLNDDDCCDEVVRGCDAVCDSGLVDDECGECGGDGVTDACDCDDTSGLNDDDCCDEVVRGCDAVCDSGLVDDECGECGGGNTDCLPDGASCDNDDECESDVCDECGVCGGDGPGDYLCEEIPVGFAYNQSMLQAFYLVGNAYDALGNTLVENEDWVGAFKGTTCVGSTKWEGENTTIAVMGEDGYGYTEGYMLPNANDIPTFIVFDGSEESMFTVFPYMVDGDLAFVNNHMVSMESLLPEYSAFERDLDFGSNLVSFYVLPLDPAIDGIIFESILDCVECVITEGRAACYDPETEEWSGSLLFIEFTKGYWVLVNTSCTLSFAGFNYNPSREYCLHTGANLISFPAQGTYDLEASIPDDVDDSFEAILSAGNAAMNTENGWVGSLSDFNGGDGYWVIVSEPFCFRYDLDDGIGRKIDVYSETMPTFGEFKVNQSTEQAFYFVDEITLLDGSVEAGDWLLSYNGDVLTGIRQWQGVMVDVPVMGASDDVLTADYFVEGGLPSFKILKQSTGDLLSLDGDINKWSSNGVFIINSLAEVEPAPEEYHLNSIYPNPFNPITTISFGLAEDAEVSIEVYNIQGSIVETLASQYMEAGYHSVVWDADQHSSGIYFVKMLSGSSTGGITGKNENVSIQKMMLIK